MVCGALTMCPLSEVTQLQGYVEDARRLLNTAKSQHLMQLEEIRYLVLVHPLTHSHSLTSPLSPPDTHTSHTLYSHSHTSSHPHTPYISTLTLPHTPTLTSHSHTSSHSHHLTLTHLIFPLSHLTPSHTLTHPTLGGRR